MFKLLLLPLLFLLAGYGQASRAAPSDGRGLFDAAVTHLQIPHDEAGWTAAVASVRQELGNHPSPERVNLALNSLLASREARGHGRAHVYGREEQTYWTLAACFGGDLDSASLLHAGAWFERHGKRWFVRDVIPGGPAQRAGLVRGDEIVSVDGEALAPVASFARLSPGAKAAVLYRRLPWEAPRRTLLVPTHSSLAHSLLRAVAASYYVRNVNGTRVAYVALPLSCQAPFEDALVAVAKTAQIEADALVLDLRGDYGPGGLTYVAPFLAVPAPGDSADAPLGLAPYAKRLVVLIDAGTSGGRELLAGFLQKQQRAILVGAPSAGWTTPGRAEELLAGQSLLWVEPAPAAPPQPLIPELRVDAALVYAAGADAQLDRAFAAAAKP